MRGIIIQGSARGDGNTDKIVHHFQSISGFDRINLIDLNIDHYQYENNRTDDFISTMEKIIEYEVMIFATPVYWYSMSGHMKIFFDRFTDLLKSRKDLGRRLKGKTMGAISCGSGPEYDSKFFLPFIESSKYLGMIYIGEANTWVWDENIPDEAAKNLSYLQKLISLA